MKYLLSLIIILYSITILKGSQLDTITIITECYKGNSIIPANGSFCCDTKYSKEFKKINLEKFSNYNLKESKCVKFKGYCFHYIILEKGSSYYCVFDTNNDLNFDNDSLIKFDLKQEWIMLNSDSSLIRINQNKPIIELKYESFNTWLILNTLMVFNNGTIRFTFDTYEYRIAKLINNNSEYKIRIETQRVNSPQLDYSAPYITDQITKFNPISDQQVRLHEFIKLGKDIYKFIYISPSGDTLKLLHIEDKRNLFSLQKGYKAKEIKGVSLNGDTMSLNNFRSKYLLIVIWYDYEPILRSLRLDLKNLYCFYGGNKFEILGVNFNNSNDFVNNFIKSNNINWPQIILPKNCLYYKDYYEDFKKYYTDYAYLIDSSGIILDRFEIRDFEFPYKLEAKLKSIFSSDYVFRNITSRKHIFSYQGNLKSTNSFLFIKKEEETNSHGYNLFNYKGKWWYSENLQKGGYLYYFNFDGKIVLDPNNPIKKKIDYIEYSYLEVK